MNPEISEIPYTKDAVELTDGVTMRSIFDDDARDVYYVTSEDAAVLPEHSHRQTQLIVVLTGRIEVTMQGVTVCYGANSVCVIPPTVKHVVRFLDRSISLTIFEPPVARRA